MVVGVGGDEHDVLLSEAGQAEVVACCPAGVDDVKVRPGVRCCQVVQVDVRLHHHQGHVVQVH